MGLDMYLTAKRYLSNYTHALPEERDKAQAVLETANLATYTDGNDIGGGVYVSATAAYWRKANQIHGWFVDNVQGGRDECQESYVTREQLEKLLHLCIQVKADWSKAEELLPVTQGFFFGSDAYEEWYRLDINNTIRQLERVLRIAATDRDVDFYYQASW